MKQYKQKQYAGVWLDNDKAMIITNTPGNHVTNYTIQDKLEAREAHGGGSEHSMNSSKQSDSLKYFKALSSLLLNYDEILVFAQASRRNNFKITSRKMHNLIAKKSPLIVLDILQIHR